MPQAIIWSGGKPYEYVDGALQEIQSPQVYTMPDGTRYTYDGDGVPQPLPAGQTTAAPTYAGTGIGVPQFLIDQNPGKTIDTGNTVPIGGNENWTVGNQVYSGTQWNGEGSAPWTNSTPPGYYNYENTPLLQSASQSGKLSQLNGTPYTSLDSKGNVTGQGNWSRITDSNNQLTDSIVIALVGAALGGIGAYGGAAGAGAGAAGSGAGFVGEGAASGVGAWDGALAGAGGGAVGAGGAGAASGGYGGGYGGGFVGEGAASGVPAWDGALSNVGTGAGAGAGTTGSGFVGEGTTSGVPAWDNALARVGTGTAMGAPGASGGSGGGSTTGTPPPANPYATGAGASSGLGSILNGTGSIGDYAGLLTALGGAYAGSQGQNASTTSTRTMDPRMDSLFYGSLAPAATGMMNSQIPAAQAAGNQMLSVGSGLLGQTAPTTASNPYLSGVANDMQRRTSDLLGQNNLAIQGNFVGAGGLGGSRQGVAQGVAAGKAADSLQGNVANLYGTAYAGDQNRLLQQQTLGAGLLSQGLQTQWTPLQNTAQIYSPFTGFGSTNNTAQQGGGLQGALGGALGAAQYGHNAGWW